MFDTRLRDDVIDQHEEERGDVWWKTFHQGLRGRQGGGLEAESKSGVKVKSPSPRVLYLVCKPQYKYWYLTCEYSTSTRYLVLVL